MSWARPACSLATPTLGLCLAPWVSCTQAPQQSLSIPAKPARRPPGPGGGWEQPRLRGCPTRRRGNGGLFRLGARLGRNFPERRPSCSLTPRSKDNWLSVKNPIQGKESLAVAASSGTRPTARRPRAQPDHLPIAAPGGVPGGRDPEVLPLSGGPHGTGRRVLTLAGGAGRQDGSGAAQIR